MAPSGERFIDLFRAETQSGTAAETTSGTTTGEPFVSATDADRFGLALSGGGIRSATFNLGVLQALARLGLLKKLDYLSTVSGGGYIGGWWSRYRKEHAQSKSPDTEWFPENGDGPAPPAIAHVRRFGNFLSPRIGLFESETWAFAIAILAAMLPSLLATTAFLVLVLNGFLGMSWLVAECPAWTLGAVMGTVLLAVEIGWHRRKKAEPEAQCHGTYALTALFAIALCLIPVVRAWDSLSWRLQDAYNALLYPIAPAALLGAFDPTAYLPAALLAAPGLLLLVCRGVFARWTTTAKRRARQAAYDRALSRFLVMGLVYGAFAVILHAGYLLRTFSENGTWIVPASAAGSGGLFAFLARRFSKNVTKKLTGWAEVLLKRQAMQVLAIAAVLLAFVATAVLVNWTWTTDLTTPLAFGPGPWAVLCAFAIVLVTLVFFDPNQIGLHAAYRARLARAYLGGARAGVSETISDERAGDDILLSELADKPHHLVCCTVNDLAGDPLANLDRGGRSAVLSRHGLAIGDAWRPWAKTHETVSLAAAMTASAAAFNSNMGSISKSLGPAAAFVMAALNLRLGLWVRHPSSGDGTLSRWFKGYLFFVELLGLTRANARWVHLSDGGHFENLALYELVRRRCRLIIVSDCGQDDTFSFDDLGNAIRRIRADFGVDIELDVRALRPGEDGLSRRAVAVGRIVYGAGDVGTLVYLKPTLTGDEPGDVRQYKARNPEFPHQSTGDQFYDETQWESYRRLGQHVATTAFAIPGYGEDTNLARARRENLSAWFSELHTHWYPPLDGVEGAFLQLTERCAAVERDVQEKGPSAFVAELYPELRVLTGTPAEQKPEHWYASLYLVLAMTQLMEDVFVGARLAAHPDHPLNIGWMNYFNRWTSAPTFRALWPILRPISGPGLRRFLEDRFNLDEVAHGKNTLQVRVAQGTGHVPPALYDGALAEWRERIGDPTAQFSNEAWVFLLELLLEHGGTTHAVPAGVLVAHSDSAGTLTVQQLHIMRGLWGAGLGLRFLETIRTHMKDPEWPSACPRSLAAPIQATVGDWDANRLYRAAGFVRAGDRLVLGEPIPSREAPK